MPKPDHQPLDLAERLSKLPYTADATDAERLMTDSDFEQWVQRQLECSAPAQMLCDTLTMMSDTDAELALAIVQSSVHSPTLARMFHHALRRQCAKECASLADGLKMIDAFQAGLRGIDDAVAEDRRALARKHNGAVRFQ